MGIREYQGAGGLRLHLDDPLSPEMEKQVARGHLVPVTDSEPAAPQESSAPSGRHDVPKKPAANAKVDTWREYAIALGMDPDQAKDATKSDCQDYAQVVEDSRETAVDPEGQE
ncbi:hypothetical protein [Streptomyces sp. SID2119]|uniref:hypothetical protein n=1 Tax=Streptomyces sp. SID2119 TaxID=2690253 RepID=UPI00137092BE|nr:hypothetical protein [Streptomyces sp. SID2119]MYW34478.1 hypothetical protein [Streptomyces sp. SID2119]